LTVYSIFSQAATGSSIVSDTGAYTMGMEFALSAPEPLTGIWFYSAAGAGSLPGACCIFTVATTTPVAGTTNNSPSWSGAAGSGWVKCSYDGTITLASGTNYRVAVFDAGGSNWYSATAHYWDSGPGSGGITNGPLTAFQASLTDVGQDGFFSGGSGLTYPNSAFQNTNYWMDVEVTSGVTPPAGPVTVVYQMRMMP